MGNTLTTVKNNIDQKMLITNIASAVAIGLLIWGLKKSGVGKGAAEIIKGGK